MENFNTELDKSEEIDSFVMYKTFEPDADLDDKEYRQCVQAIFDYGFRGKDTDFDNKFLRMWWRGVKLGIDKAKKRRATNRKNGQKGGAPANNQNAAKAKADVTYFNDNIYRHFKKDLTVESMLAFYHENKMKLSPDTFIGLALKNGEFIHDWRSLYVTLDAKEISSSYSPTLSGDLLKISLQQYF